MGGGRARPDGGRGGLGRLRQQLRRDVRKHAALRDGYAGQQLAKLFVVAHGQLYVPGRDAALVVIPCRIAGEFDDLGRQVLKHGGEVDRGAGANAVRVAPLAKKPVDAAHRELKTRSRRPRLGLG